MNNATAKFILRSYRSSGEDARDPAFREALEQANRDPNLKDWLQQEMQVDDAVRERLAGVPVPAALMDDILASHRVTTSHSFWRKGKPWLAIAALFAVLLGGVVVAPLYYQPKVSFEAFPRVASMSVSRPYMLDRRVANLDEARQWMHAINVSPDISVTDPLKAAANSEMGCRTFTWRGRQVAMLCFFLDDGRVVHLFIMDRQTMPDAPRNAPALIARHRSWNTATWTDDQHAYVMTTKGTLDELQALL